jgi:hypothetical protein
MTKPHRLVNEEIAQRKTGGALRPARYVRTGITGPVEVVPAYSSKPRVAMTRPMISTVLSSASYGTAT